MATKHTHLRIFFFTVLALIALVGIVSNSFSLLMNYFYLWPGVRLVGYASLLVYALLMLRSARYNSAP